MPTLGNTAHVKPLLLMDIDGPLNPFEAPWYPDCAAAHGREVHHVTTLAGEEYTVALDPTDGPRLRELSAAYDLVWATTWNQEANRLVSPLLGLPDDLPNVPLPEHAPPWSARRAWKADLIAPWCAGREFAWFDDDINDATRDWLAGQDDVGRHLALRVPAERGLTEGDFETLREFARDR